MHHKRHHHGKHRAGKHHHAEPLPVAGEGRRRAVFLALLSAAIIFLFIFLPFWLLYKRSVVPPAPEAFGPTTPTGAAKPNHEPMAERPASEADDETVRFK